MPFTVKTPANPPPREIAASLAELMGTSLLHKVERALRATGYLPLRRIDVDVHFGVVTLRGRVPSYHMKQLAQATALVIPGVCEVCNQLEVAHPRHESNS